MTWPGAWQDLVIGGVGWCFALALIPMLRRGAGRPPLSTSLLNAGLLALLAGTVFTLGARFGALAMLVTAGLWGAVAWRGRG
jgi:hypothetical protein